MRSIIHGTAQDAGEDAGTLYFKLLMDRGTKTLSYAGDNLRDSTIGLPGNSACSAAILPQ
jgi:hypothetical protein